jgi:hypothetical protein
VQNPIARQLAADANQRSTGCRLRRSIQLNPLDEDIEGDARWSSQRIRPQPSFNVREQLQFARCEVLIEHRSQKRLARGRICVAAEHDAGRNKSAGNERDRQVAQPFRAVETTRRKNCDRREQDKKRNGRTNWRENKNAGSNAGTKCYRWNRGWATHGPRGANLLPSAIP